MYYTAADNILAFIYQHIRKTYCSSLREVNFSDDVSKRGENYT